jgi:hypothetical protein
MPDLGSDAVLPRGGLKFHGLTPVGSADCKR